MARPGAALVLPVLLVAVALAGCAAPPPPPAPAPAEEEGPRSGLVASGEVANLSQPEEPSEFARSLDEKFHTHNYWGSSLEKLLMDEDVASGPLFYQGQNPFDTLFTNLFRGVFGRGVGFTPFALPEGSIVPPEAERVEVTVTWPESPTITGMRLGYQAAQDRDFEALEPFPAGGGTVTIPTNLSQNDMPHTTVSKWRFYLLPEGGQDAAPGVFNGTVHVMVKAFRSDILYVAPPHRDFWGANTTLPLSNATGTLQGTRAVIPVFTPDDDGGFAFVELPNGTLVPPHTGSLTLTLTWTNNAAAPDPFGIRPDLMYFAANSRRPLAPDASASEPGRAVYTIPVDAKMVDSPYAEESEWGFLVFLRSSAPTDQPNSFGFGSVGVFDGTYALEVVADREAL